MEERKKKVNCIRSFHTKQPTKVRSVRIACMQTEKHEIRVVTVFDFVCITMHFFCISVTTSIAQNLCTRRSCVCPAKFVYLSKRIGTMRTSAVQSIHFSPHIHKHCRFVSKLPPATGSLEHLFTIPFQSHV